VERRFKRFLIDRDRLGSAGICGASCPISCPSVAACRGSPVPADVSY